MARTINLTGQGLQLWKVKRFYVELYANWPQATPDEVWREHVTGYQNPRGKLGICLDGSLTLGTPARNLPPGFVLSGIPGQPVRCLLGGLDRLARVIAVLPSGDEVVIYTGVIGPPKATGPYAWSVPLFGPGVLRMQRTLDSNGGALTPAGIFPYAPRSALFGNFLYPPTPPGPEVTYESYWKAALADNPLAEFGVGPDLVFAAGDPRVSSPAAYALDARAYGLKSENREITPYLTHIRRSVAQTPDFFSAPEDAGRTAATPRFTPDRTGFVQGQVISSVTSSSLDCATSGGGDVSLGGAAQAQFRSQTVEANLPRFTGRLQDVTMIGHIDIGDISGVCDVYLVAQAHTTAGGFIDLYRDRKLAITGSYDLAVKADAKALAGCDYISFIIGMEGAAGATVTASVSPGPARPPCVTSTPATPSATGPTRRA